MVKKLERPRKGRVLGGVCMAFANYFKIDVVFIRFVMVLLLIPGGLPGLVLYVLGWIIIPSER